MNAPLYSTEILRLAAATAEFHRLEHPGASVEKRSPVCGSRVTVDLRLGSDGTVTELGQEVRACALGQASAALLARGAVGKSADQLATARDQLRDWLAGKNDTPGGWPGLDIFEPARSRTARHAAILLAFEAAAEAAHMAQR